MFDRFSANSKRVMSRAHQAAAPGEPIAPTHILLGMLELPASTAVRLLQPFGIDHTTLREALLEVGHPPEPGDDAPLRPDAKLVLEHALAAAAELNHTYVGTEHLLLGLVREGTSLAAQVLQRLGVELATLQAAVANAAPQQPRSRQRLLLISNSTMHGSGYLEHCTDEIRDFLGPRRTVLFVPYALYDHDAYALKAKRTFAALGHDLASVHTERNPVTAVAKADAVFIGGGNTFRLLKALYHHELIPAIQQRAEQGMPYIGSSAGTNVATPSIRTTNDMPIVMPPSFAALQLVPFQINAHYIDRDPGSTHMGETREDRLRQFHEEHETPVLGLREGGWLRVEGDRLELRGTTKARLFRRQLDAEEFTPPCDLSMLLRT